MKLEGANKEAQITGMEKLPGIVNYFIGSDPSKWRTNIPTYKKVEYKKIYPGIDLAYYGNQGKLEYDLVVAPGADPTQIKLAFEGATDLKLSDSRDLILTTDTGDIRLQKPLVYQVGADGHKTLIAGNYVLLASEPSSSTISHTPSAISSAPPTISHQPLAINHSIGIQVASYDTSKPLIIDPVLFWATYLGGSGGQDLGFGIAVDAAGNAFNVW